MSSQLTPLPNIPPNPTPGADENIWGTELNDVLDALRTSIAALFSNQQLLELTLRSTTSTPSDASAVYNGGSYSSGVYSQ